MTKLVGSFRVDAWMNWANIDVEMIEMIAPNLIGTTPFSKQCLFVFSKPLQIISTVIFFYDHIILF